MALPDDEEDVNTSQPATDGSSTVLPGGIVSPQGTTDPNAMLRQVTAELYKSLQASNQPVQLPSLQRSPSDGTRPGWLGLLGEALSGGQSPLYHLSGQQEDMAGSRALMNFGINMMLASGPNRVKPNLFSAAASGLQGAEQSMDASQQAAYTQAGQQFAQQKDLADLQMAQQQNRIKTLQAALPLLTLQARTNMPSLYGAGPGTSGGPGGPGAPGGGVNVGTDAAPNQAEFVKSFTPIAQQISAKTGLPVDYLIGQAGLETGWGTSAAYKNNNYFGISPDGKPASYATPQAGIDAYTALMQSDRYKNVPRTGSPQQIGDAMARAGYNPNVPKQGSSDSYGARLGAFAGSLPAPGSAVRPYQIAGPANTPPPSGAPPGGLPTPPLPPPEGVPLPGDTGLRRFPSGDVGTPTGGGLGRGPQVAGPPGAVPVPGAPPGVVTTPPAVTPPAVTPPAVTPPMPTAPMPAPASRALDYNTQDKDLNPEEYQERHFTPLTAEQVKTYAPGPSSNEAAAAADQVQRARENVTAMQTQLDQMRRGLVQGDPARQAAQVTDAQKELDAAENTYNEQVQKLAQSGAKNLLDRDNAERQRVSGDYKATVLDPRNAAALATQQGQQQIALEQAKGQTASDQKVLDTLNETQTAAREAIDQTNMARSLSQASGDPGFWQMMQSSHPETVKWLSNAGALPQETVQQLGNANAMDAAFNKLITMARFGTGFSRPTNLDVQILTSQAPQGTDPQSWREAKLAYMQTFMQRQDDYVNSVYSHRSEPGVSLHQAQVMARSEQQPIVPQMDAATAADPAKRQAFAQQLPQNSFFRAPDGQLLIWPPPPSRTQGAPAQPQPRSLVPTN